MKPVAIFRHSPTEGPGYFATFLEAHRIPWRLIAVDSGDPMPEDVVGFAGLAFMGGPMSVNDTLPWIDQACRQIRAAVAADTPVIGHCLGGQLMSRALGGTVTRNRVKEIGWGRVEVDNPASAVRWLGDLLDEAPFTVFQWHGETFSLPQGATRLLRNDWCENQSFVLGPHLAMQCHVEMTPGMIRSWSSLGHDEAMARVGRDASVQTPAAMIDETAVNLPAMRRLARQLYGVWIDGLARR